MSKKIPELSINQKNEINSLMPEFIERLKNAYAGTFAEDYKFSLRTKAGTLIITEFNEVDYFSDELALLNFREGVRLDINPTNYKLLYSNWFCTHNNTQPKEVEFADIEDIKKFLKVLREERE